MALNKAFKFRLKPSFEQMNLIERTFGSSRFVYNMFLAKRIKLYENENKSTTYNSQAKELPELKKTLGWLKEVDSIALQSALQNLDKAYKSFFRKLTSFPKFKSKKNPRKSYTTKMVNNNIFISGNNIRLPKLGFVKFVNHRQIPQEHKIKSVTISKSPTGKYYISVLTEYELDIKPVTTGEVVGLDFKMDGLYVDSKGEKPNFPKFYRTTQSKLAKEQRRLSRKVKGSSNYNKQKLKVAKLHEKIANQRRDFLHKTANNLLSKYRAVIIEDLNMQSMSKSLNFGKSVHDNGWGIFTEILQYKAELQGKQVEKVDKHFASTKTCSVCMQKNPVFENKTKLQSLAIRTFVCPFCGHSDDRDINAAKNILREGHSRLAW